MGTAWTSSTGRIATITTVARQDPACSCSIDVRIRAAGMTHAPNEFYTTREDMVLVTVLGSCVAACIHDRTAGIGGMNHFMLPDDGEQPAQAASDSMRYGAYAMEVLINELIKMGGRRERFEAKVFGGAAVLAGSGSRRPHCPA